MQTELRTEQKIASSSSAFRPEVMRALELARSYEAASQALTEHIRRLKKIASTPHDSFEYAVQIAEKLNKLELELTAQIDKFVDAKMQALNYISVLEGEERAVIERYYLLRQDWSKIAEEMYMSERRVFILRKKALRKIGAI